MTDRLYLLLALVGAIVPWVFFARFLAAEPFGSFVPALFANGAAAGFTTDLLVSSMAFWIVLFAERGERPGRPWLFVAINLTIGLSCALPLYLWARQRPAC